MRAGSIGLCIYQSNICAGWSRVRLDRLLGQLRNEVCADLEETIEEVKDQEGPTQGVREFDRGAEATLRPDREPDGR